MDIILEEKQKCKLAKEIEFCVKKSCRSGNIAGGSSVFYLIRKCIYKQIILQAHT